jgi:hypothetical protein
MINQSAATIESYPGVLSGSVYSGTDLGGIDLMRNDAGEWLSLSGESGYRYRGYSFHVIEGSEWQVETESLYSPSDSHQLSVTTDLYQSGKQLRGSCIVAVEVTARTFVAYQGVQRYLGSEWLATLPRPALRGCFFDLVDRVFSSASALTYNSVSRTGSELVLTAPDPRAAAPERVEERYAVSNPEAVRRYLHFNPFLAELLTEADDRIKLLFGNDTQLKLELLQDPESDEEELFIVIVTAMSSEDAIKLQDRLENEWWLANLGKARQRLNIDIEFIHGF